MSPRGGYRRAAGRELQLSLLTGMVRGADFEKVLENPIPRQWVEVQALPTKANSKTLRFAELKPRLRVVLARCVLYLFVGI